MASTIRSMITQLIRRRPSATISTLNRSVPPVQFCHTATTNHEELIDTRVVTLTIEGRVAFKDFTPSELKELVPTIQQNLKVLNQEHSNVDEKANQENGNHIRVDRKEVTKVLNEEQAAGVFVTSYINDTTTVIKRFK